ncbi:hypothetical protein Pint_19395 [Pistacia integerrima]|uniref:Uncharacterized protein n=1 Tax=Pistacia integerrima TaxID=434235 RepID=A0ACC0YTD5_9ROSI|nr:hypothetical protein Pint_19395 [Pistacia integerrima]
MKRSMKEIHKLSSRDENHWGLYSVRGYAGSGTREMVNIETANFSTCILIRWDFRDAIEIVFCEWVESYLRIIGEPKIPSVFLQVRLLLVLGEYGAADGKFSASYSSGKLHDVAEAYSNDETVKVSLFSWKVL